MDLYGSARWQRAPGSTINGRPDLVRTASLGTGAHRGGHRVYSASSCVPPRCSRALPLDGHRDDVQKQRRPASCHPRSAACDRVALCASVLGERCEQHLVRRRRVHEQHVEHHQDSAEECHPWGQQWDPSLPILQRRRRVVVHRPRRLAAPALASSASHTDLMTDLRRELRPALRARNSLAGCCSSAKSARLNGVPVLSVSSPMVTVATKSAVAVGPKFEVSTKSAV